MDPLHLRMLKLGNSAQSQPMRWAARHLNLVNIVSSARKRKNISGFSETKNKVFATMVSRGRKRRIWGNRCFCTNVSKNVASDYTPMKFLVGRFKTAFELPTFRSGKVSNHGWEQTNTVIILLEASDLFCPSCFLALVCWREKIEARAASGKSTIHE